MIFRKFACSLTLAAMTASTIFGQALNNKKPTDDPAALKKEAVAFLRETMSDVNNLRTLENRISFSSELAGLMWFHDEKEARSLYLTAFGNFKELLMQYDQQMNSYGDGAEGEEESYRGGLFADVTERSRIAKRFQAAMKVRQQIAMSLAEHDAELAFAFYFESLAVLTNPEFRRQMEMRDQYFEVQLMTQIAETNAAKASQFAIKSIADGVNYQHIELLKKIYAKDAEKGAEFAASILSKLKTDNIDAEKFWVVGAFLDFTGESFEKSKGEGGKKAALNQSDLRDLADIFAQAILRNEDEPGMFQQYLTNIEKYNPSRGVQIRAKFKKSLNGPAGGTGYASNAVSNTAIAIGNAASNSNNLNSNDDYVREREQRAKEREQSEKQFQESVEKLGSKQLPKEEREKIVAHARRILLQTPGKDKKILGLSALAAHVGKAGDKELAAEIMKDAQALVNPLPKNYQDFILTWMLASGYAAAEPEKAFPLLEDTILRVNDTLSAFIKVGEFIDVAGEMIDEGEVQVGAFGGQMVRGLTSELNMADATLRLLARADFNKTKNLTSRFDRSEVRILAKMMILRSVLGEEKQKKEKEADVTVDN